MSETKRDGTWRAQAEALLRHDLISDLATVINLSEVLERDVKVRLARLETDLVAIRERSRSALDLLREYIDIIGESGQPVIHRDVLELGPFLMELCRLHQPLANRRTVVLQCNGDQIGRLFVAADRSKLQRLLSHLLTEALWRNAYGPITVTGILSPSVGGRVEIGYRPASVADRLSSPSVIDAEPPLARQSSRVELAYPIARGLAELIGRPLVREERSDGTLIYSLELPAAAGAELDSTGTGLGQSWRPS